MTAATCRRCAAPMGPGIALVPTVVAGYPDDVCGLEAQTFSFGGPGQVVAVRKCTACGWSVTDEEGT